MQNLKPTPDAFMHNRVEAVTLEGVEPRFQGVLQGVEPALQGPKLEVKLQDGPLLDENPLGHAGV